MRSRRCHGRAYAAALTGLLLASAPLAAQETPKRIGFAAGVETVAAEIDVLVTDAQGRPVTDLGKDDFRLVVDGRPLPVDWVEAPEPAPAAPALAAAHQSAAPKPAAGSTAGAAPARLPHSTVLLIDDLHLDFSARYAGLRGLRQLVRALPPGEEVAVYAFRLGLRRLQPFTSDRTAVLAALDRAGRTTPTSGYVDSLSDWMGWTGQFFASMRWLLRSLANRPEPKTFVVLARPIAHRMMNPEEIMTRPEAAAREAGAGGWTRFAAARQDLLGDDSRTRVDLSPRGEYFFTSEGSKVADEALLARATVVAVDPSGLRPGADVEAASLDAHADPWDDAWSYKNDALALVAHETGGSRLGYNNRPGDLVVHEADLLEHRYRLGFTPAEKGSARRDVRVEVTRPGLRVRSASGQRTQTRQESDRARFAALVLSDGTPKGDFAIAAGPDRKAKKEKKALPYEVFVPLDQVLLEETAKGPVAKLEFLFAAVDKEGRTSDLQARPLTLRLPPGDDGKSSLFRLPTRILKPKHGTAKVLIGVRDRVTGRLGVTSVDVKS